MTTRHIARMAAAILLTVSTAQAAIINVPGDEPTIQAGIDAAMNGDEIVVAPGTYFETINFLGKAITLRSSGGPEVTIIDAGGDLGAGSVVTCDGAEGPGSVLQGFTITGGVAFEGGGMYNDGSSPTVIGCVFEGNSANLGGGIYVVSSSPTIVGCRFSQNSATGDGGAIYNLYGSPALFNCLMSANSAAELGGAIFSDLAWLSLTNCTLTGNTAHSGGGIANYAGVEMTLSNCILWANLATVGDVFSAQLWSTSSSETVNYTCIEDLSAALGGEGNIDSDPLFVDSANGDYRLQSASPCIDAGHNWSIVGITDTDLDGNPRFTDDLETPDTGCGVPVVVDMGAYEFQGDPFPVKLGDIDGDGVVGITDFLALLADWGSCTQTCCLADLDLDGNVGITDFLILLGNWG